MVSQKTGGNNLMAPKNSYRFDTLVIHAGQSPVLGRGHPAPYLPDRLAPPSDRRKLKPDLCRANHRSHLHAADQPHQPGTGKQIGPAGRRPGAYSHVFGYGGRDQYLSGFTSGRG